MIPRLASPSVCVIDDEKEDYEPILNALMSLGLGCVHVPGRVGDPRPPKPFDSLRLVFADLHLSGQVGKAAASHTANVVKSVVSAECGPILIIIWSKYAEEPAGEAGTPPEDQPTEADLFITELLNAEPRFKSRLVFAQMNKPKLKDRPAVEAWVTSLKGEIEQTLNTVEGFDVLWTWEAIVRSSGMEVSEILANLTDGITPDGQSVGDKLKLTLRLLAQGQGGPDCTTSTAQLHLMTVFSQIGLDAIETAISSGQPRMNAEWLAQRPAEGEADRLRNSKLNAMLLTSSATNIGTPFLPGMLYSVTDCRAMSAATGFSIETLQCDCFNGKPAAFPEFKDLSKPVFLEISPSCDFHQGNRRCATLVAGLACPLSIFAKVNSKDAWKTTPVFEDRTLTPPSDIGVVFCARYRYTTSFNVVPAWLQPRIRFREMLTTDIRNWHSSQASRAGYLSF